MTPKRIQRKRSRGWRMPEGVVYVGRPTLWGNPYALADVRAMYPETPSAEVPAFAVKLYRRELEHWTLAAEYGDRVSDARREQFWHEMEEIGAKNMREAAPAILRGKDLACWCRLDQPCHADVLLKLANAEPEQGGD